MCAAVRRTSTENLSANAAETAEKEADRVRSEAYRAAHPTRPRQARSQSPVRATEATPATPSTATASSTSRTQTPSKSTIFKQYVASAVKEVVEEKRAEAKARLQRAALIVIAVLLLSFLLMWIVLKLISAYSLMLIIAGVVCSQACHYLALWVSDATLAHAHERTDMAHYLMRTDMTLLENVTFVADATKSKLKKGNKRRVNYSRSRAVVDNDFLARVKAACRQQVLENAARFGFDADAEYDEAEYDEAIAPATAAALWEVAEYAAKLRKFKNTFSATTLQGYVLDTYGTRARTHTRTYSSYSVLAYACASRC